MKFKRLVCLIATLLFSNLVFSHGVVLGYVTEVRVENNGKVLLTFDRDASGSPPACSSTRRRNMAFNLTDAGGEGMLSASLAAQASGNLLRGRGAGSCTTWSTIETALYVVMVKAAPN